MFCCMVRCGAASHGEGEVRCGAVRCQVVEPGRTKAGTLEDPLLRKVPKKDTRIPYPPESTQQAQIPQEIVAFWQSHSLPGAPIFLLEVMYEEFPDTAVHI